MKIKSYIVIVMFLTILTVPTVVSTVQNELSNINYWLSGLEDLDSINERIKKFEERYNDSIPYKNLFVRMNSVINYRLFNQVSAYGAVSGSDNWLFYTGEGKMAINDYIGNNLLSNEQLINIKKNVEYLDSWCDREGIEFVLMFTPNKEHVYSRYLPKGIKEESKIKKIDQIYEYLKMNTDVKISYAFPELINASEDTLVYHKYDTHWNDEGAFIGYKNLMDTLDLISRDKSSFEFVEVYEATGDLITIGALENLLPNTKVRKNLLDPADYKKDIGEDSVESLELFESSSINQGRLYFVGDSFRTSLKPYLIEEFSNSSFIHRTYATLNHVQESEPDVLVFQVVERYLGVLESTLIPQ